MGARAGPTATAVARGSARDTAFARPNQRGDNANLEKRAPACGR